VKSIILFLLFVFTLTADDLNWSNDYKQALKDAKESSKAVYVLITSDSCRWCRKFEQTTLQDRDIKERLEKEFITVHLSRDRDVVPSYFLTTPIPRHYFVDAKENILFSSLGHRDEEIFQGFMDNANKNKIKENINEFNTNK